MAIAVPTKIKAQLNSDLLHVFPQLEGVQIEQVWSGLMSYARHQMPLLGQLDNNYYYALGFGGHGVDFEKEE